MWPIPQGFCLRLCPKSVLQVAPHPPRCSSATPTQVACPAGPSASPASGRRDAIVCSALESAAPTHAGTQPLASPHGQSELEALLAASVAT